MTHIPPITREARDYLLKTANEAGMQSNDYLVATIIDMPLAPADPLDAVRARWKPLASATITAYDSKYIFGHQDAYPYCPCAWDRESGMALMNTAADLTPASPHAALIAELREAETAGKRRGGLLLEAADALEKQP